ncbi:hypothetical protein GCM10010295_16380 [Streptomyces intermedius]
MAEAIGVPASEVLARLRFAVWAVGPMAGALKLALGLASVAKAVFQAGMGKAGTAGWMGRSMCGRRGDVLVG